MCIRDRASGECRPAPGARSILGAQDLAGDALAVRPQQIQIGGQHRFGVGPLLGVAARISPQGQSGADLAGIDAVDPDRGIGCLLYTSRCV